MRSHAQIHSGRASPARQSVALRGRPSRSRHPAGPHVRRWRECCRLEFNLVQQIRPSTANECPPPPVVRPRPKHRPGGPDAARLPVRHDQMLVIDDQLCRPMISNVTGPATSRRILRKNAAPRRWPFVPQCSQQPPGPHRSLSGLSAPDGVDRCPPKTAQTFKNATDINDIAILDDWAV